MKDDATSLAEAIRGGRLSATEAMRAALAAGLEVTQPEKIKNNVEFQARVEAIAPDAIVVVAYKNFSHHLEHFCTDSPTRILISLKMYTRARLWKAVETRKQVLFDSSCSFWFAGWLKYFLRNSSGGIVSIEEGHRYVVGENRV